MCDLTYGKELTGLDRIQDFLLRDPTFYCDLISVFPLFIQPIPPAFALLTFPDIDGNQSGGSGTGVTPFTTIAKILESFKLVRGYRLIFIPTSHLEAEYSITVHITRVFMWVFLIAHDLGCLWFLFMEMENTTQLHIENDNIYEPRSVLSWYLFAFRDGVYILLGRTRP